MNVYQKLQKCRVELQEKNLKKSGNNKFAGYDYYELSDFLPTINKLMLDNNLSSIVTFTDMARLTIINADKPEETIVFESPLAEAQLKGCHAIQNLGAVQTYLRRYLYSNAFEIVEADALDATMGKDDKKKHEKDEQEKFDKEKVIKQTWGMLLALNSQDEEMAKEALEVFTSYTDKQGHEVKGVKTFTGMSDKMLQVTYGKVKVAYLKMKEGTV